MANPFVFKTCTLAAISTGDRASSLLDLRNKLMTIHESSIYYHFWGSRVNPQFVDPEHHNDFAHWVFQRLHDHILAERLNVIEPTEYQTTEELRQELLDVIERRLDEYESILWTRREDQFHFISSKMIVLESIFKIDRPEELVSTLPLLPPSSIFYHLIDARTRTAERKDDFSLWLKTCGKQYEAVADEIQSIDPFFSSLSRLKETIINILERGFHD